MIAAVLRQPEARSLVGLVGATSSNMNDDWGLPLTVLRYDSWVVYDVLGRAATFCAVPLRALRFALRLADYPKLLVLEFGTHSGGHLKNLVRVAPPNIAVVTTIGPAHLDHLKTVEGVFEEKSSLLRTDPPPALVVIGDGHDFVSRFEKAAARSKVVKVSGRGAELSRSITEVVCNYLGVSNDVVNRALSEFHGPKSRLEFFELAKMTVIDDSCNANPLSVKLGLDTLARVAKPHHRRVAILGFMAELGNDAARLHTEIGDYAHTQANLIVGVGELAKAYRPQLWYETSTECAEDLGAFVRENDCLLVKGSASVKMGVIVEQLRASTLPV